jgi:hypothetical protein
MKDEGWNFIYFSLSFILHRFNRHGDRAMRPSSPQFAHMNYYLQDSNDAPLLLLN